MPNAISGRDFGASLRPIPAKKASLWMIVDACHSGEMVPHGPERARQAKTTDLGTPRGTGACRRGPGRPRR